MRATHYLTATLKETPADAEVISHQLMLRAGLIRRLAAGLYTWLPMGLRVLRKAEHIVREEMDNSGALELLMPAVQPAELWEESGRWQLYGKELLRLKDRHERDFCVGPTHEEVITDIVRNEISSYRQLPVNFYQIQTKFRDERRPRFGIMRAREFLMKDAYSFHLNPESLDSTYRLMYDTYTRIFRRFGLEFRPVQADSGSIGGSASHEFHVLADSGEDYIAFSTESDYAANVEMAAALAVHARNQADHGEMTKVATPNHRTIEQVSDYLQLNTDQSIKTLIVYGTAVKDEEPPLVALLLRGDHKLNEVKAEKLSGIAKPLTFANEADIKSALNCTPGSIGPVGLKIRTIVDHSAAIMNNFVCGANEDGFHFIRVSWGRDCVAEETADLRNVVEGDPSPDGKGVIVIKKGIEVGHVFKLGDKYSKAMNATVLDPNGKSTIMSMGCYGIGISRIVASAIEQKHDANGIIWPDALAPFHVIIIPLNVHKSDAVKDQAENIYQSLQEHGIEVLLDDRNERPGIKFADADLIGIPHRVVVSDRGLKQGTLEYKGRLDAENTEITVDDGLHFLLNKIGKR